MKLLGKRRILILCARRVVFAEEIRPQASAASLSVIHGLRRWLLLNGASRA
jgi:hypothetical protein